MTKNNRKYKLRQLSWLVGAIAVIFVFFLFLIWVVYRYNGTNRLLTSFEKFLPFPAAYIKGAGFISIAEIKSDDTAVKKFYESQDFSQLGLRIDFNTDQGKNRLKIKEKDIINKLIENKIIETLAQKRGISVDDATVNQEVDDGIAQYGNRENLMSELSRLYGWSIADFEKKVVKPELYAEKLSETFSSEIDTSKQQAKINDLYDRVANKKEDFTKVAQGFSEGDSAKDGGDLGWSTRDQLITEVADKAFSMKIGEISNVITSPLGFHILKLEDKKTENGDDMVHLRQIFVKTDTFADWLKSQTQKYLVAVFLHDYEWDSGVGQIVFRDQGLRDFEANLQANSEGDPSVFP